MVIRHQPSKAMKNSPNWQDMPYELMENILQRLRTVDVLKSAWRVCRTWRKICKDPAMWKAIDMHKPFDDWDTNYHFEMLTKHAVEISRGELIDIRLDFLGTDDLLHRILLRSSKLKRLCLMSCYDITGRGLSRAVQWVPRLEELRLSFISINEGDIMVIGRNCPQLKSFMLDKAFRGSYIENDTYALAIAYNMPELRRLELFDREMTNDGLVAILNGCPHLQSVDVRLCYNLKLGGNLKRLCTERIKDFKCDSIEKTWDSEEEDYVYYD